MSSPVQILFAGLAGAFLAVPSAAVTIASFTPVVSGANLRFVNDGTGSPDANTGSGGRLYSTVSATGQSPGQAAVIFSFASGPLAALGPLPAWLMLDATTAAPASVASGIVTQGGLTGTARFISRTPLTVGTTSHAAGIDLLRADFTAAALTGALDGTAASFDAGDTGSLAFTSTLINFDNARDESLTFGLDALLASFTVTGPGRAVQSFRSEASGSAAAVYAVPISAVPEPENWALLITGFALVGVQQRRRARRPDAMA